MQIQYIECEQIIQKHCSTASHILIHLCTLYHFCIHLLGTATVYWNDVYSKQPWQHGLYSSYLYTGLGGCSIAPTPKSWKNSLN